MIISQPTESIIQVCKNIEDGIQFYLDFLDIEKLGRWESEIESIVLINACIRNIGGILELARKDLNFVLPAKVLARSIFEAAITSYWLISDDDIFECESRWLGRVLNEEIYLKKLIKMINQENETTKKLSDRLNKISDFRIGVEQLINEKGYRIFKTPNFRQMLSQLEKNKAYIMYIHLCQFSHSTHNSGSIFRRGLGTKKEFGEQLDLEGWYAIFSLIWNVFDMATEHIATKIFKKNRLYSMAFKTKMKNSLDSILNK